MPFSLREAAPALENAPGIFPTSPIHGVAGGSTAFATSLWVKVARSAG